MGCHVHSRNDIYYFLKKQKRNWVFWTIARSQGVGRTVREASSLLCRGHTRIPGIPARPVPPLPRAWTPPCTQKCC